MEQKKLLLIAISVGVFFVIVIGSALVFLKPAADMIAMTGSQVSGTSYIGAGYNPGTNQQPQEDTADYFQNNIYDFEPEQGASIALADDFDYEPSLFDFIEENFPGTITIEPESRAGVPDTPVQRRTDTAVAPRPVETRPAPASGTASAAQTVTPPRAASPAPVQIQARIRDDYWVQTGAFTVLSRAENVKQTLADKGITSIIENRSVGDTLYFRVRIGPYTSEKEADYWLNLIKSISGFEESQIRKTQTML